MIMIMCEYDHDRPVGDIMRTVRQPIKKHILKPLALGLMTIIFLFDCHCHPLHHHHDKDDDHVRRRGLPNQ